jgi:hypothetical protein
MDVVFALLCLLSIFNNLDDLWFTNSLLAVIQDIQPCCYQHLSIISRDLMLQSFGVNFSVPNPNQYMTGTLGPSPLPKFRCFFQYWKKLLKVK